MTHARGDMMNDGGGLGAMRAPCAGSGLCLQHALLVIVVLIACLCLVSMAIAQEARPQEAGESDEARVRAAMVEAVRERMGADVVVTLESPRIRLTGPLPARIAAVPDIGSHAGGSVRFVLFDRLAPRSIHQPFPAIDGSASASAVRRTAAPEPVAGRRIGSVDVELFVEAEQLRAVAGIARGATLTAGEVESARADAGRVPLKPLPPAAGAIGATVNRDIAAGQTITAAMLVRAPLVRSGDEVRTRVRIGELEAHGTAVASQSGALGDEIQLVNADSRRRLKGRVIGTREVEVLHEE